MKNDLLIEAIVARAAPRGWFNFLWKLGLVNGCIATAFVLMEVFVHGHDDLKILPHIVGVLLLSVPLSAAGFAAIWYLNRLRHDLARLAATDLLTGLNNRRAFLEATTIAATQSRGILMMLDLDNFKQVNDTYGHAVGDECLRAMAEVMRKQLRANDVVGRIGGEEFAVFLADAPIDAARSIGERISAGASISIDDLGEALTFTASVGAVKMSVKEDLESVLARADEAMYAAKDAGRARLVFWERRATSGISAQPA